MIIILNLILNCCFIHQVKYVFVLFYQVLYHDDRKICPLEVFDFVFLYSLLLQAKGILQPYTKKHIFYQIAQNYF